MDIKKIIKECSQLLLSIKFSNLDETDQFLNRVKLQNSHKEDQEGKKTLCSHMTDMVVYVENLK
jgi:hypothetical protein